MFFRHKVTGETRWAAPGAGAVAGESEHNGAVRWCFNAAAAPGFDGSKDLEAQIAQLTIAAPETCAMQPQRLGEPQQYCASVREIQNLKFRSLLNQIKCVDDCDVERVRNAAAGLSRSKGGLNISDFAPILSQFNFDIRGLDCNRAAANAKLTQLLQLLGLQ